MTAEIQHYCCCSITSPCCPGGTGHILHWSCYRVRSEWFPVGGGDQSRSINSSLHQRLDSHCSRSGTDPFHDGSPPELRGKTVCRRDSQSCRPVNRWSLQPVTNHRSCQCPAKLWCSSKKIFKSPTLLWVILFFSMKVYTVGIGDVYLPELQFIASDPDNQHVFLLDSFNNAESFVDFLSITTCDGECESQNAHRSVWKSTIQEWKMLCLYNCMPSLKRSCLSGYNMLTWLVNGQN